MQNQRISRKGKRSWGIRAKLIAVIVPIVIIIIVSFFALSRNVIIEKAEDGLIARSEGYVKDIHAWSNQILTELTLYKDTIESGGFANDDEILEYMKISFERNSAYPAGLYMGDDGGAYLDASEWVPDDDWILTERDWYLEGREHELFAFGEPYYDSKSGDMCVSASVRMSNQDVVRVLAVDVYLDYVCDLVSQISAKGDEKAFLVTKSGQTVIAHPDANMMAVTLDDSGLDKLYADVSNALGEGKSGLISLGGKGGTYLVYIDEVPETDWLLVSYVSRSDVLADLAHLEFIMILIALVAALVLSLVTLHLMDGVVKPVKRVTDLIQKVADGDLSQNIEIKGNDEISQMGMHIQNFLVQMRKTMSGISETAQWLEQQSESNDHVSGSLMESSRNQAEAMEALNRMVDELSAAADEVSRQMTGLSDVINEAGGQSREASKMMRQTVEVSEKGRAAAKQVSNSMQMVEESITSLSELISETENSVEQIGDMVSMIVDVAEETNLLSLNASIEAARAGEGGRGFAVVAEQIGKLAVSSAEAADNISKLTGEIRQTMSRVVSSMQDSASDVRNSTELVGQTQATFGTVYEKVGEADQIVNRMTKLIGDVELMAERMQQIASNQVSSAGEITNSAHELDEYTRTVGDDSGTVAQSAKELERESKNLMERIKIFRME
ncbi:MAG: methyl-accepting chemotaxis protein [Lachnospiraceae bacterium]|nr:methyl-accepting chemotaxis protein [Lachnospiraceae bacterium]